MEESKPVTIGKVLKVSVKRWKVFVPVMAALTLLGTLLITFVYNPYQANYVGEFSYSNLDLQKSEYADGSSFSYAQLISKDNLNKIKESKAEYANINVDKLVNNNKISITRSIDKDNTVTDDNSENQNYVYTLKLNRKYFASRELAASFAYDIAHSAIDKDEDIVNNYVVGQNFDGFESLSSFEDQIKALVSQAKSLSKLYGKYGDSDKKDDSSKSNVSARVYSLAVSAQQHLNAVFPTGTDAALYSQIATDGFVKDYSVVDLTTYKSLLQKEKADNEALLLVYTTQINNMGGGTALTDLPTRVEELTERNVEVETLLNSIDAKIANKSKYDDKDADYMAKYNAFAASINNYKNVLVTETASYKDFLKKAYVESGTVSFEKTNYVEEKGNINIFLAVAVSLLAGVIVGGVCNLIIDRKKLFE